MGKIKPFDKGFFAIHNCVFDVLMPSLTPNGFKILCVAIRKTLGWNKQSDLISYTQFMAKSGIRSKATVSAALQECLSKGYLLRVEQEAQTNLGKPSFLYRLNTDFELVETSSTEIELGENPSTEIEPDPSSKFEPDPSTDFEHTTIHKGQQHGDADYLLSSLLESGIDKTQAKKLIKAGLTQELLDAWLEYIENHNNLQNPVGFLVSRLKLGEFPPIETGKEDQGDTNRYLCHGSEFDGLILS